MIAWIQLPAQGLRPSDTPVATTSSSCRCRGVATHWKGHTGHASGETYLYTRLTMGPTTIS